MEEQKLRNETKANEKIKSEVKGMLTMLQISTEKFLEELNSSYDLINIDIETDLTKKIKKIIKDTEPGKMENGLVDKFLMSLTELGKKIIIEGYIKRNDKIDSAYILSESAGRVLYGIVPKDNLDSEVRGYISNLYSTTSHWEVFKHSEPLFQVIPKRLISKINTLQEIDLV